MKECKYCHKSFPETDFGVAKTTSSKYTVEENAAIVTEKLRMF